MAQATNYSGKKARLERGKEIDWTKVIPSITRPVWEPPALEVLDMFEEMDLEDMKHHIPDPATRIRFLELLGEMVNLQRYLEWTLQTQRAAEENCDQEKVDWYEDLYQTLIIDVRDVWAELKEFSEVAEGPVFHSPMGKLFRRSMYIWDMLFMPESDTLAPKGSKPWLRKYYNLLKELRDEAAAVPWMEELGFMYKLNDLNKGLELLKLEIGSDSDTSSNEASSSASYRTARGDTSSRGDEELGNLIDLDSSPTSDTEDAAGISAILETTGITEMRELRKSQPKPMFRNKTTSSQEHQAVALFTFMADKPGDLAFKKGDVITVTGKTEKDFNWWTGTLDGKTGIFPSNYVLMKSWETWSGILDSAKMRELEESPQHPLNNRRGSI